MKKVNCPQTKCIYNIFGGCKPCKQCHIEPNIIDEDCDICWNCSNDLGILRWEEDDGPKEKEKEINKPVEEKPMELKVK